MQVKQKNDLQCGQLVQHGNLSEPSWFYGQKSLSGFQPAFLNPGDKSKKTDARQDPSHDLSYVLLNTSKPIVSKGYHHEPHSLLSLKKGVTPFFVWG